MSHGSAVAARAWVALNAGMASAATSTKAAASLTHQRVRAIENMSQNRLGVLADMSPPRGRGRHVQGNVATKHIRTCCTAIGPQRLDVPAPKRVFFSKKSKLFRIRSE